MFKIGCHLSASAGYIHMFNEAKSIGANTFQFFTRNPRGGKAKDIDPNDVSEFNALAKDSGFAKIVAHAPYTLNACSAKEETRKFAFDIFTDDLKRMEYTPNNYYNFHPGSHVGQGVENGIDLISDMLNQTLFKEMTTTVLLETMAGKGSEVGGKFEEIRNIIDKVTLNEKLGVCLDTCHIYDGGYDIVGSIDNVLERFDKIIGIDRLKAVHLNDSMYGLESHKDRHAKIGEGKIGNDAIIKIINHPTLRELPFILETPNDIQGYAKEIEFLKENRL